MVCLQLLVAAGFVALCGCGASTPHGTTQLLPTLQHTTTSLRDQPLTLTPVPGTDATWTSEVIGSTLGVEELIASWNADVPEGTAVFFEARARSLPGTEWTPWLMLGHVDRRVAPAALPSRITAPGGYIVDVDILRCKTWFRDAQVRCTATTNTTDVRAPGPAVVIHRLDVTRSLAFSKSLIRTSLARETPHWVKLALPESHQAEVTFKSQQTPRPELSGRLCSPTSVAMAVEWATGTPTQVITIADAAYDQQHNIYGNWPRNIQAAWEQGVPGRLQRFGCLTEVYALLAADKLVVASIKVAPGQLSNAPYASTDGHLILIKGYTPRGDLLVSDPAASDAAGGERIYSREDLSLVWLRNRKGTAYVFWKQQAQP